MAPQIDILLTTEQSSDAVGMVQLTVPPKWDGPPLHHHDFDEAFYMREGEMTFQLGDELRAAGPGELIFAARGTIHTLANLSDRPARYVLICTPGEFTPLLRAAQSSKPAQRGHSAGQAIPRDDRGRAHDPRAARSGGLTAPIPAPRSESPAAASATPASRGAHRGRASRRRDRRTRVPSTVSAERRRAVSGTATKSVHRGSGACTFQRRPGTLASCSSALRALPAADLGMLQ